MYPSPAHKLAVRMRIDMVIIIIAQLPINHVPAMHHAPATALTPRVCTLVPFITTVITVGALLMTLNGVHYNVLMGH